MTSSYSSTAPSRRQSLIAVLFGLWLTGTFAQHLYTQIALDGIGESVAFSLAAVVWPPTILLLLGVYPIPTRLDRSTIVLLIIFSQIAFLSCLVSPYPVTSFGFLVATLAGIYVAVLFSSCLSQHDVLRGLQVYSLLTLALLLAFAWFDFKDIDGDRLGSGTGTMNPNALGLVAMSVCVAAFSHRGAMLRFALLVPALWVIYASGSRASAVGTALALSPLLWFDFKKAPLSTRLSLITPFLIAVASYTIINWDSFIVALDQFFLWNDPHRGFVSGGSGRAIIWEDTLDIINRHPFIGVGFRAHSEFLTTGSSAHNGYLAMIAEIGVFGSTVMFLLIAKRLLFLFRLYVRSNSRLFAIYFGFTCGFLFIAVFERFLLNVGNPTSLLFLFIIFGNISPPSNTAEAQGSQERVA